MQAPTADRLSAPAVERRFDKKVPRSPEPSRLPRVAPPNGMVIARGVKVKALICIVFIGQGLDANLAKAVANAGVESAKRKESQCEESEVGTRPPASHRS